MADATRISVDRAAFRELIQAIAGPDYLVREIKAIYSIGSGPLPKLIADFKADDIVGSRTNG
jgi:hypothetical protein